VTTQTIFPANLLPLWIKLAVFEIRVEIAWRVVGGMISTSAESRSNRDSEARLSSASEDAIEETEREEDVREEDEAA